MSVVPNQPIVQPGTLPSTAAQYDLAFQIAPIILQGGIVSQVQGGLSPITTFLPTNEDGSPFARFVTVPGGTILDQAIGMYPFANQQVAANATIQQPLKIALLMIAPVNTPGGYLSKLAAFTSLQNTLTTHNAQGGTYIVATPGFIYYDMVFLTMADVTEEIQADGNKQAQILWQLDFLQPIVTLAGAAAAQSALFSGITAGTQLPNPPTVTGTTAASPANLGSIVAALNAFGAGIPIASAGSTGTVGPEQ